MERPFEVTRLAVVKALRDLGLNASISRGDSSWGQFETMLSIAGIRNAATISAAEGAHDWLAKVIAIKLLTLQYPEMYPKRRRRD